MYLIKSKNPYRAQNLYVLSKILNFDTDGIRTLDLLISNLTA